jgi:hypothetical protein
MMQVIWVQSQQRIPKIGTATDWHDGQFSHDMHAQFSLGLSGKSVPRVSPGQPLHDTGAKPVARRSALAPVRPQFVCAAK